MIAMDLLLAIHNPFAIEHHQIIGYHCFVWVCSIVSAIALRRSGKSGNSSLGFCWIESNAADDSSLEEVFDDLAYPLLLGPMMVIYSFNAIVYFWVQKRLKHGLPECWNVRRRALQQLKLYVCVFTGFWAVAACAYFVLRLTNGLKQSTLHIIFRFVMGCKGVLNALLWSYTQRIYRAFRMMRKENWDGVLKHEGVNWALRREIVHFATKGIRAAAVNIVPGNPQVVQYPLISVRGKQQVDFRDYRPQEFARVRQLSAISTDSYLSSMRSATQEHYGEGKSGAFLYYSGDRRFVLKTCTKHEQKYILDLLPAYTRHLEKNPESYISRYVGCHQLKLYGKVVRFTVMLSVFDPKVGIHERFDLKGSWVGRIDKSGRKGTLCICRYCGGQFIVGMSKDCCPSHPLPNRGHEQDSCGKDLNWASRHLDIEANPAHQLNAQLVADSNFLASIDSLDYSLLVGIHYESSGTTIESRERRSFVLAAEQTDSSVGSPLSDNSTPYQVGIQFQSNVSMGPAVVYIGIIDILTPWSVRKRLEYWMHVYLQCLDRHGISCVDPTSYANRFQRNVVDVLTMGEGTRNYICDSQLVCYGNPAKEYFM